MDDLLRLLRTYAPSCRTCVVFGVWSLASALGVWGRATLVLVAVALGGCAALPSQVERPVSYAGGDASTTVLARVVAASTPEEARGQSGFRLLPDGSQAFDARLALVRRAERTLDVQYYLIAGDGTGLQFLRELQQAAARGVRVRVLVDDLYATGEDALFAGLAAEDNVEVRMFNPLPVRSGSFAQRVALSLHEFSRINRRMHNKLFIADGALAISGGRNIADEYFGRSEPANFIDMDILSTGPVVGQLAAVFDSYWNSAHSYPIQSLIGPSFDSAAARRAFVVKVAHSPTSDAPADADSLGQSSVESQLARGRIVRTFANATVFFDPPCKADEPGGGDASADGVVSQATLDLISSAHSDVLLASPYFVPGQRGLEAMQRAAAQNVRLTVMTNSLATTDEPLAHFGYARYRNALLSMGVNLYELMPTSENRLAESALEVHGSFGRLHAKLAVVDDARLFVGSMNMDRRSAEWNTELGLVIDSPELAQDVARLIRHERLPSSYRLRVASAGGALEWISGNGAGEVVRGSEPGAGAARMLRLWVTSRFVGEDLL
jgi:phosphatidylserine/phosphatidylglycerophosphate/cardiolipin synthase-like enzyme